MERDGRFALLAAAARFVGRHPLQFLGVGIATAVGRATQLEAFGELGSGATVVLEIIVEGARVLLLLSALGAGRIGDGVRLIRGAFVRSKASRPSGRAEERAALWREMGWGFGAFVLLAVLSNAIIALVVRSPDVLGAINQVHPRVDLNASSLTLVLKNLTIISFTLVFVGVVTRRGVTAA